MIAGGTEAAITPLGVGGFAPCRRSRTRNDDPERASRPFDRDRDGFVIGEGAGILVLEELEHARGAGRADLRRDGGLRHVGRRLPHHGAREDGDGATASCGRPSRTPASRPEEVDYINAHGTSTPRGDAGRDPGDQGGLRRARPQAGDQLHQVDDRAPARRRRAASRPGSRPWRCATRLIPPTINLDNPDPECDLDYVPNEARRAEVRYALSNSFGFGGTNGALLFKRFEA